MTDLMIDAPQDETKPIATRHWRFTQVALAVVATAALCVLQLIRQAGTPSWQTIWAEDGSVYTTDALRVGAVETLFRGYAGYVQVVPRVLALVARVVPIARVPLVLAVLASLCCALLAVFVFRCTARWIDSMALRLLAAAMVALAPVGVVETTANITNLGWPLLVACFWAILSRQESRRDTVLRSVVVAMAALSTTIAVLLAPLALGVAWYRRRRRDWTVATVFGMALAVQLLLDRSAGTSPPRSPSSVLDIPEVFGVRVLGEMVYGDRWLPNVWSAFHFIVIPLTVLILALVASLCTRHATPDRWWFAAGSLAFAFALFAVPVWIRGTGSMHLGGATLNTSAARYVIAPIVVATSGLLVLVDASGRRWLRYLVAAHGVLLLVVCLRMPNSRSDDTSWAEVVDAAAQRCRARPTLMEVHPPISPGLPWTVIVPCSRLR